jgi:hypothetical protein
MSTTYGQYSSPEQQKLWEIASPWLAQIYSPYKTDQQLWNVPDVSSWMPDVNAYKLDSSTYKPASFKTYQPDFNDYLAGGDKYASAYAQIAPSRLNAYGDTLEILKSTLANQGTLGSNYGGISGAAADVLLNKQGEYAADINKAVYEQLQPALTSAYGQDVAAGSSAYGQDVGFGSSAYGTDTSLMGNAYSTTANAINKYFEEYMKEQQYPFEQVASLGTAALPTTTSTTEASGGSK